MLDKFREMKGKRFICFLFAFAITNAIVIWITLTSREIGVVHKAILVPFKSYIGAFGGNNRMLLENIGNIFLFIPFGFLVPHLFKMRARKVILIGFFGSLTIECIQLLLGLGTFETDDLINNTAGTAIGVAVANIIKLRVYIYDKRATALLAVLLTATTLCLVYVGHTMYMTFHAERMTSFAGLGDEPGRSNLLRLDGVNGTAVDTNIYIKYENDGTIVISGSSGIRTWYRLGEQTLGAGTYVFKGLSGMKENTIAIELEYYDTEAKKFVRLTPDVGAIEEAEFTLDTETTIRAYVGIYPVGEQYVIAKPVIYKLGD